MTEDAASDADADALLCFGGSASEVLSDSEEHPAVARANRQMTPAVGFRKLRMRMPRSLVISLSGGANVSHPPEPHEDESVTHGGHSQETDSIRGFSYAPHKNVKSGHIKTA